MLTTSATSEYRSQIVVEHAPHVRTVTFRLGKRTYHFSWGLRRDSNYRQLLSHARTSTSVLADLCRRAALNINDLPRGNGIWRIDDKSQGRLINYAPRKRRAISRWSGNRQTEKRNAYENVGVFVRRYRWSDKRGKPSVIVIRLHKLSAKFGNGKIPWSGVRVGMFAPGRKKRLLYYRQNCPRCTKDRKPRDTLLADARNEVVLTFLVYTNYGDPIVHRAYEI